MTRRLARALGALVGAVGRRVGALLDDLALAMLVLVPGGERGPLDHRAE